MIYYNTQEWMKYQNDNSKNLNFDVHFSITIAYKYFKFCLVSLHIHAEGIVSQIFNLGLGFYFMSKNGKHFLKLVSIIFEIA